MKNKKVAIKAWVSVVEEIGTGKVTISGFSLTYSFPCIFPVSVLIDEKFLNTKQLGEFLNENP